MMVAEILGVLGFVLACTSLGWHVWKYTEGRREKVEAKATMEYAVPPDSAPAVLIVYVRNTGDRPVYISEVVIAYTVPVVLGNTEPCGDDGPGTGTISLFAREDPDEPLRPGQEREYTLGAVYHEWFEDLAAVREEDVCVRISSPAGLVRKLADPRTRELISQFVKAVRLHAPDIARPV